MVSEILILNLVEPKKKNFISYVIVINAILLLTGFILSRLIIIQNVIFFLIFIGIPFVSTMTSIGINHNLKNFKIKNDRIILQKEKLILVTDSCEIEQPYDKIEKIILKYNGFDEGPFNHPIFNPNPKYGNGNFIEIYSIDNSLNSFEFYIKTERDSIVLKNILMTLRSKIKIEIIFKNVS